MLNRDVSTSSTTRVNTLITIIKDKLLSEKKSRSARAERDLRAEDRARTGHLDLGKVALYQMSYFRINDKNLLIFRRAKISVVMLL